MLYNISEEQAQTECETTQRGTSMDGMLRAIRDRGDKAYHVTISETFDAYVEHLYNNSFHFPILLAGEFRDRYFKQGRDRARCHAVLVVAGMVYDPSEKEPMDLEVYEVVFNKSLSVQSMIIVENEVHGYGRNK